jgi:anti-sigma factor RsiW
VTVQEIDCERADTQDFVARYLGGRLPEDEAAGFESHFVGCDRCWAEVDAAVELRLASGMEAFGSTAAKRARPRDAWTILAAAAAVAMIAVGLRQLVQRPDPFQSQPVWRGPAAGALSLTVGAGSSGRLALRWAPQPEAETYVVEVFAADGSSLWRRETPETTVSLESSDLPPREPGIPFYATVEALDSMRQSVARSSRAPLPQP